MKVANSRCPETTAAGVLAAGVRGVTTAEALTDMGVAILSIPLLRIPGIASLIATSPVEVVVIDTSNYYSMRDGWIDAIDAGELESLWVVERLGRPIAKAFLDSRLEACDPSLGTRSSFAAAPAAIRSQRGASTNSGDAKGGGFWTIGIALVLR